MPYLIENKKFVVETVRRQMRILNGIVLLVVYALLFLIVRFLYLFINYITTPSLVAILSIIAGLVVMGMYIANTASKKAIRTIDEYADKLNALLTTTRDIREIMHGDILLENIMQSALKITSADAGSIMLIESKKTGLYLRLQKAAEARILRGFQFQSLPVLQDGLLKIATMSGLRTQRMTADLTPRLMQ